MDTYWMGWEIYESTHGVPGRMLALDQTFRWRPASGRLMLISEMTAVHAREAADELVRRARQKVVQYHLAMLKTHDVARQIGSLGDVRPNEPEVAWRTLEALQNPEAWVRSKPLYRALVERAIVAADAERMFLESYAETTPTPRDYAKSLERAAIRRFLKWARDTGSITVAQQQRLSALLARWER